jgi:ferredoxin-NADP reductase
MSPALFRYLVPDLAGRDVYVCGAPAFAAAVRRSVKEIGLPKYQLHEERFDF